MRAETLRTTQDEVAIQKPASLLPVVRYLLDRRAAWGGRHHRLVMEEVPPVIKIILKFSLWIFFLGVLTGVGGTLYLLR